MPIAKARLFDEMTVQRLVEELASDWGASPADVCALLANVLEANAQQQDGGGIAFYYKNPTGAESEDCTVSHHPLKIPISGKIHGVINALQRISSNEDWEFAQRVKLLPRTISAGEPYIPNSLKEIFVENYEIMAFLSSHDLPVPQDWREILPSGGELTQSAQSKGGSRRKYSIPLQVFINNLRDKITADETLFTLSTVKDWLRKNVGDLEKYQTDIPDCDDVNIADGLLHWTDGDTKKHSLSLKSLEPYIKRAKAP